MHTIQPLAEMLRGRARHLALATIVLGALAASAIPVRAADLPGSFGSQAYGVSANAKAAIITGNTGLIAYRPIGCDGTNGDTLANRVTGLSLGPAGSIVRAQVVRSTVYSDKTASSAVVRNKSVIKWLNALNGLITADAVKAAAEVSANSSIIRSRFEGSSFGNLKIAGNPIAANVAPNTKVTLPGVGHVLLKRIVRTGDGSPERRIIVEMLRIVVERTNTFDLPVGAVIILAHANAKYTRIDLDRVVGGNAYVTTANNKAGSSLQNQIGRQAFLALPCEGTDGKVLSNEIDSLSVGSTLNVGTGLTRAFADQEGTEITAWTSAEVRNVRLLGNLIRADLVRAVARDRFSNGTRKSATKGTRVTRLRVAGVLIGDMTAANVKINVPGAGFLIVNERVIPDPATSQPTVSNGLHLFVNLANSFGLPVGSEIIISHAQSFIVPKAPKLAALE